MVLVEGSIESWSRKRKWYLERPLREREVVGSIPGRAIPKALKIVPVATLLGPQHYKASTGSSLSHY